MFPSPNRKGKGLKFIVILTNIYYILTLCQAIFLCFTFIKLLNPQQLYEVSTILSNFTEEEKEAHRG